MAGWLLPGSPPRRNSAPATVALVPAAGIDVHEVAAGSARAMPIRALDPVTVDQAVGPGAARSAAGSPDERALADYLDDAEVEHPLIVLIADPEPDSPWTERVLRRADRVLVAAPVALRPDRPTRGLLARIAVIAPEVPRELVFVRQAGQPDPGGHRALARRRRVHPPVAPARRRPRPTGGGSAGTSPGRATGLVLGGAEPAGSRTSACCVP